MRPVIHYCLCHFLKEGHNSDEREYEDTADQIREVLIHANYFSQKDIESCLDFDINALSDEEDFEEINALFDTLAAEYRTIEEDK